MVAVSPASTRLASWGEAGPGWDATAMYRNVPGLPRFPPGEYSRKVQQLTRTRADLRGRGRTVTCTDGRGWTCCLVMACKRSAVRARLAPPGEPYNSNNLKHDFERLVVLPGAALEPSQPPLTTSSTLQT